MAPQDVIKCHEVPLAVPRIPYRVGLCLEAPCTQLTRSLYPQGYILNHHVVEDAEDTGDGVEAFVDDEEALTKLEKH